MPSDSPSATPTRATTGDINPRVEIRNPNDGPVLVMPPDAYAGMLSGPAPRVPLTGEFGAQDEPANIGSYRNPENRLSSSVNTPAPPFVLATTKGLLFNIDSAQPPASVDPRVFKERLRQLNIRMAPFHRWRHFVIVFFALLALMVLAGFIPAVLNHALLYLGTFVGIGVVGTTIYIRIGSMADKICKSVSDPVLIPRAPITTPNYLFEFQGGSVRLTLTLPQQ